MSDFFNTFPSIDLTGKSILVTGGTGSFGKKFIKTILDRFDAKRIVVFSRDEFKQYEMSLLPEFKGNNKIRYFIGDVRDKERLILAMRDVDYVVHAAALKHVPAAEYNPFECIKTNVIGAQNVVEAALFNRIRKVVALSTDKAASPANLYGASKLASDKIFVASNNLAGSLRTRFSVVRYGNVIGSRGSVVPFFENLKADGADVFPITDPRMTRFWITLQQGVDFVLSSFELMRGGEIFIPKIPSMNIVDLAKAIDPKKKHEVIGIRPGEKLHEIMVTRDDSLHTVDMVDRYTIEPSSFLWDSRKKSVASRKSFESEGYKKVDEGFEYASDTNNEWLDINGLSTLLYGAGTLPDADAA